MGPLRKAEQVLMKSADPVASSVPEHVAGSGATLAPGCLLPLPLEVTPEALYKRDLLTFFISKLRTELRLLQLSILPYYLARSGYLGLELRTICREISLKGTSLNIKC